MGNFLSAPITDKESMTETGNHISYGFSCMQGWRAQMEDAHCCDLSIKEFPKCSFFAVFDGHGGDVTAKFTASNILQMLVKRIEENKEIYHALIEMYHSNNEGEEKIENVIQQQENNNEKSTNTAPPAPAPAVSPNSITNKQSGQSLQRSMSLVEVCSGIGKILNDTFMEIDAKLLDIPTVSKGEDFSGSTAVSAFLTPEYIIVANTGDSRCILAKGGSVVPMSFDHKPNNLEERTRIETAGGTVRHNRVNGDLGVARALGDFNYKGNKNLGVHEQQVSPCPDIRFEKRDQTDEFLIIACDGIWDVMSNDALCEYIRGLMLQGEKNISLIAEEVIDHCLELGSRDNMSIIIIVFEGAKFGEGSGVEAIRKERALKKEMEYAEASKQEENKIDGMILPKVEKKEIELVDAAESCHLEPLPNENGRRET